MEEISSQVTMEVVCKLLGHSSKRINEESYASIINKLILRNMEELLFEE